MELRRKMMSLNLFEPNKTSKYTFHFGIAIKNREKEELVLLLCTVKCLLAFIKVVEHIN